MPGSTGGHGAVIRPFQPGDRQAVRTLCADTANAGSPVETFFPDRELLADLITAYYTDSEPESSWVAEVHGTVVGYLNGCLDSRTHDRIVRTQIVPRLIVKALLRGTFFRPQAIRYAVRNRDVWRHHRTAAPNEHAEYPSHLHLNLSRDARGQHLGRRLVDTFLADAAARGSAGVHAGVREDNLRARRFFEGLGFAEIGRVPALRLEPRGPILYSVTYGLSLRGRSAAG